MSKNGEEKQSILQNNKLATAVFTAGCIAAVATAILQYLPVAVTEYGSVYNAFYLGVDHMWPSASNAWFINNILYKAMILGSFAMAGWAFVLFGRRFSPEEKGKLPLIFGAIACGLCGVSALFWLFTLLPAEVGFRIDRPTAVPFLIIIFWLLNLAVLAFIILRHRQIAAQPETVPSAPPAPAQSAPKQTGGYYERDNVGTRQDTVSQANAYWLGERFKMPVKPPFTLFTMPSKRAAEEVLLSLPFMHRAKDSGKIICDRIMTYGVYETTLNGKPTGEYEVLITGFEFTLDEYNKAEEGFTKRGGKCKSHEAPDASVTVDTRKGDASKVRYKETVRGNDGVSTYEVYSAPDKASATAFLKTKPVTRKLYYIVVDTPEGSFGRDINGFYQE